MIRFAWLQARNQTAVAVGLLVVVAIVLALTGPHILHLYDSTVATCHSTNDCNVATASFLRHDPGLETELGVLVLIAPALIGIFWGAPLVARELENGSFRLAWTQSVTRDRWLVAKLGVVGLAGMATAGLLSLAVTWWASPLDRANANLYATFDERNIVPVGYALFAFTLGVTAGVLIRRTLPAMAAALAAFVAARLAFVHLLRPRLFAPTRLTVPLDPASTGFVSYNGGPANLVPNPPDIANAWVYSTRIVNHASRPLTTSTTAKTCPGLANSAPPPAGGPQHSAVPGNVQVALQHCVGRLSASYHTLVTYQPASRYWALQWYELAVFTSAALVLAGICFWTVRRHLD